jgi:hypothetical protein
MRPKPVHLVIAVCAMLTSCAGVGLFKGNDTGGIIAWSPEAQANAADVSMAHCARYGKVARITSINARFGDYIGFVCQWPLVRTQPVVSVMY